jgi:menaquinone-9 beta-reductase
VQFFTLIMFANSKYDVVIAGAGPAGIATALFLVERDATLARRIAIVEKSRHPRPKVCAGGLIPRTIMALQELDVPIEGCGVEVFNVTARSETGVSDLSDTTQPLCTIVRRDEFDARLARAARERGVEILEDTRVIDAVQSDSGVKIVTDRGNLEAPILVGADGSGSRVRSALFGRCKVNVGRAVMVEVPVEAAQTREFVENRYFFDFTCVRAGVRGYSWSFPCIIDGRPHLNIGIYDQCPRRAVVPDQKKPALSEELCAAFPEVDQAHKANGPLRFKSFPIRWYDAANRYESGRTILAGDAAGADPLMGEGISSAFEHGKLAAEAITRFLAGEGGALAWYGHELHGGTIGRKLRRLGFAARRLYGPHHRFYFRIAGLSRHMQSIGLDWYNGAHRMDEASIARALGLWISAVLSGSRNRIVSPVRRAADVNQCLHATTIEK